MTALARAYRRAGEGRGQMVGVSGDPGAGKSRLIHEFTAAIEDAEIVRAAATPHDLRTPFMLAACLVRALLGIVDRHDRAEAEGRLTAVSQQVQWSDQLGNAPIRWLLEYPVDVPEWGRFDPSERRKRAARAVRDLVLARESRKRLVLVLEDIHWIDPESQETLDTLVDSLALSRVLVLATFRPEFQPSWGRHSYYTLLNVPPLDDSDAETLIKHLIGDDADSAPSPPAYRPDRRRAAFHRGDGPPPRREGRDESGLRGYRLQARLNEIQLPETIQGVLAERMDGLPPGSRSLLQVASVIGTSVPTDLLQRWPRAATHC